MAVVGVAGSAPVWQAGRTRCKEQVLAVGHALAHPRFRKSSSWCVLLIVLVGVIGLVLCRVAHPSLPPHSRTHKPTGKRACR